MDCKRKLSSNRQIEILFELLISYLLTVSFNALPALKLGTFAAAI